MGISIFEAAVAFDYEAVKEISGLSYPVHCVVFDTDNYAVGFCRYSETGQAELIAGYALHGRNCFWNDVMAELAKSVQGHSEAELKVCLEEQMDCMNSEMRTFLRSDRQIDGTALTIADLAVRCSELERIFGTAMQKLDHMLSQMEDLWTKSGFDEDFVRIIMVGSSADYFFTEYHIRSKLSFEPFLIDPRFVNSTYKILADQIAETGEKLYNEHNRIGVDIDILVVEGEESSIQRVRLAAKEAVKFSFEDTRYEGPLFIAEGDNLELEVDRERRKIKIPYSLAPTDSDIIDVGICIKDQRPQLRIRRCNYPTHIYDIPI